MNLSIGKFMPLRFEQPQFGKPNRQKASQFGRKDMVMK